MRFAALFLFIIIFGSVTRAQKAPARVETLTESSFISKKDGFQIDFPARPARTVSSIDTAFGKTEMVSYKLATSLAYYGVDFIDFPTIINDKAEIALRFESVKAHLTKDAQYRLISETEISFGGNPSVEYVLGNKDTTTTIRGLFMKQRFFQMTVVTNGNPISSTERVKNFNQKATEKFIKSFFVNDLPPPKMAAVKLPKDFGITVENNSFSSKFMGFSLKLPLDWNVVETEQNGLIKDLSAQTAEKYPSRLKNSVAFSFENTEILLVSTKTKMDASVNSSVFMIAAEEVSFPNFSLMKVAEKFVKTYADIGRKVLKTPEVVKINGFDFVWSEIENTELKSKQRLYIANRNGIALEIMLIYQDAAQLKEMLDSLATIKFE